MTQDDDIRSLIERKQVAFPAFGSGVSEAAIVDAEKRLRLKFPASYRWWLRHYGGGQIRSDIVYGLDEAGGGRPDIVKLAEARASAGLPSRMLVFSVGNGEVFYFETSHPNEHGEYPVILEEGAPDTAFEYARDFGGFLMRRINELYL